MQECLKKVPTFEMLVSQFVNHPKEWICTLFNSPGSADSKNTNILILGIKLEELLTKIIGMFWKQRNKQKKEGTFFETPCMSASLKL